ncbi:MAG TPA: hypothetical protein VF474_13515 [Phenylobacterium sp.]
MADPTPAAMATPAATVTPARRRYVRTDYSRKVATVQRMCRRIEAGESLTEVCRDPTMPQRSTFVAWLAGNAELAEMVEAAKAQAARTFPARRTYHRWNATVAAEVLARIEDGRGLREVCAEPDMPAPASVTRWLNARPAFAEAYRLARQAQADRLFDLAWRIALEATEDEVATARLKIQTLKWRVGKLAPRKYGPLKAQAPEGEAGPAAGGARTVSFEMRHFAVTPEGRVVETTRAVRGMSPADQSTLRAAIREGRVSLAELEAMGAARLGPQD